MCQHFAEVWKKTQTISLRSEEMSYDVQEEPKNHHGSNLPSTGNCWNTSVIVYSEASFKSPWTLSVPTKKEASGPKSRQLPT